MFNLNKKIKINYINNLFWLQPKTTAYFSGHRFGYAPFKTLKHLVDANNFLKFDFYFSFNNLNEKNYDFFNTLYALRGFKFRLNKENVYKIENNGFVIDDSINNQLEIKWDLQALNWVKKGFIPFFSKEWYVKTFIKETDKKYCIKWNKNEFELVTD